MCFTNGWMLAMQTQPQQRKVMAVQQLVALGPALAQDKELDWQLLGPLRTMEG